MNLVDDDAQYACINIGIGFDAILDWVIKNKDHVITTAIIDDIDPNDIEEIIQLMTEARQERLENR